MSNSRYLRRTFNSCTSSYSQFLISSIISRSINIISFNSRNYSMTTFSSRWIQAIKISLEFKVWFIRITIKWISIFVSPCRSKDINNLELNITIMWISWYFNWLSISIMNILSKSFTFNNINNNSSSLLNLNTSLSITIIIMSINFFSSGLDKFFQNFDHMVKIIKLIFSTFFFFYVNIINISVN